MVYQGHVVCQGRGDMWCIKVEGTCGVSGEREHVVCQGRGGMWCVKVEGACGVAR